MAPIRSTEPGDDPGDREATTTHGPVDVAVIGGGAAGLAAALQLGRSRRSVVVIDAGEPRNAPAAHMHGYLGHDGLPPSELLAIGRDEVRGYDVELRDGRVTGVTGDRAQGFAVALADGTIVRARRVVLATGLTDELPDIAGVREQWGRGVIHCPYCHGWEHRDEEIVVIGTSAAGPHQAGLFRQLSDRVTLLVHDGPGPDDETGRQLAARGVIVRRAAVAEVTSDDTDRVRGLRLASGEIVPADVVVVGPRMVTRADAVAPLGLTPVAVAGGLAEVIETDGNGMTAVAGVYAAGNAANARAQVLQAAAEGGTIGANVNADLVHEELERAGARPDDASEWDARYGERGHDHLWSGEPNGTLVVEVADLTPGRALDVCCGEGADAIWLAGRGWKVTALDVSRVALDRAGAAATDAGVTVDWVCADLAADPPAAGSFDLVTAHYPALRRTPGDEAMRALVDAVAPGGTLLVVGHDLDGDGIARAREHGFEPTDYVLPHDVADHLGAGWEIEVHQTRPRPSLPEGSPHSHDTVLRARRTG
ncbi:MAG: bifunctional NAD(P)/FAD-dependent oxidoreductase/class I SAM-dependent methyltransferase [Actinomycetota bacterium]|nr:bifunctional NAD(P)/FAD-dependent oxidoreductase/class I SAM-dependent methyltransferase [Actinomycetota bacterium]